MKHYINRTSKKEVNEYKQKINTISKCSRNLSSHLRVLKEECDNIVTRKLNGDYINLDDLRNFNEHRNYVKSLLKKEKKNYYNLKLASFKAFNDTLTK